MVDATGKESASVLREIAEGKVGIMEVDDILQVEEDDDEETKQWKIPSPCVLKFYLFITSKLLHAIDTSNLSTC